MSHFKKYTSIIIVSTMAVILFKMAISFAYFTHSELMNNLIKIAEKNWELDREIMRLRQFTLHKKQPHLIGDTPKFVLESDDGELWLFKSSPYQKQYNISEAVYKFSVICGVRQIPEYAISLPINGKLVTGSLQKFYKNCISLEKLRNVPLKSWPMEYVDYIEKILIFDWLVEAYEGTEFGEFIIDVETNTIYRTDKDIAFSNLFENKKLLWRFFKDVACQENIEKDHVLLFWMDAVKNGEIEINYHTFYNLVNHIQRIPNHIIYKIFFVPFESKKNRKGSYSIELLFNKVKNLDKDVSIFLKDLKGGNSYKNDSINIQESNNYTQEVYNKLRKRLEVQLILKKRLRSKKRKKQNDISVIASAEAWNLVDKGYRDVLKDKNLTWDQREVLREKIIKDLKALEENTTNMYEKCAISIYISALKEGNFDKRFEHGGPIALHPEDIKSGRE